MRTHSPIARSILLALGLALACGCTDKSTDSAADAGDSGTSGTTDDGCASGQGVLRVAVTDGAGAIAPAGTSVHAEAADATTTTEAVDAYGDARMNLASGTYSIWADNPGAGLATAPQELVLPGCQTTSLNLVLATAR